MSDGWSGDETREQATCLADEKLKAQSEAKRLQRALARYQRFLVNLQEWTHCFGVELCPPAGHADTFGEGVREAKLAVGRMLAEVLDTP